MPEHTWFRNVLRFLAPCILLYAISTGCVLGCQPIARAVQPALLGRASWIEPALSRLATSTEPLTLWGPLLLTLGYAFARTNRRFLGESTRLAARRRTDAQRELAVRLRARIDTPALLTSHSIRALALAIESKHRSPVLTSKLISEVVRSVALELEERFAGSELTLRLESLNFLLRSLGEKGPPLLSIATLDRLIAYEKAEALAVKLGLIALVVLSILNIGTASPWIVLAQGVILLVLGMLVLGVVRARNFWRDSSEVAEAARPDRLLRPRRLHGVLDMFAVASMSRSWWTGVFWHLLWGPLWEHRALLFDRMFLARHEYRVDEAERLRIHVRSLLPRLVVPDAVANDAELVDELTTIYKQLWAVTGDPTFRATVRELRSLILHTRMAVLRNLAQVASVQFSSIAELRGRVLRERRVFYRILDDASTSNAARVELLHAISTNAWRAWYETGKGEYVTLANFANDCLQRYASTGRFLGQPSGGNA